MKYIQTKALLAYLLAAVFVLSSLPITVTAAAASGPNILAPIAVVMCFDTGEILYDRDMHRRWIPASMTKIMTAFIAYQEMEAGNLTPQTQLRVSANAARFSQDRRVEGTFVPLQQGAYITLETLLQLVMLPSGNAAAMVIAEHIGGTEAAFVERMNATAYELGMYSSFTNSHGALAHHSNAYSVAILVREFIYRYPDILRITRMQSVRFGGITYNNTNRLLNTHYFSGADGFKTGTIRAAGWGHSTTAYRDGRRVIAVVMNTANNNERMNQSRTLLQFGFDELARREAERAARVRMFHNGRLIPLTTTPVVDRGELLLPMYAVMRPLGFDLGWNPEYRIATAENSDGHITLFVDRPIAFVHGRTVNLRVPARIIDNRVFVPIEFIAAATGTTGTWNVETGVLNFN